MGNLVLRQQGYSSTFLVDFTKMSGDRHSETIEYLEWRSRRNESLRKHYFLQNILYAGKVN